MKLKSVSLLLLLPALMLLLAGCSGGKELVDTPVQYPSANSTPTATLTSKGEEYMSIDQDNRYVATITTNQGSIEIELFVKEAPKTVNNFVTLSKNGFYNEVLFHRVIPNFMIQGGDPTATGRGGPGYTFEDEFHDSLKFDKPGLLAMANAGPNTNGSQFFITTASTPHLTGRHTIFGRVQEGQDVVEAISMLPSNADDRPVEDVKIESIRIEEAPGE